MSYEPSAHDLYRRYHAIVANRIRDYLTLAGHENDRDGPLFRPVRNNSRETTDLRWHLRSDVIDRIVRKYAKKALGRAHGYSAHSLRATFITTALEKGASLEDVQDAAGHADPSTTKLYDRRGFNVEKAVSLKASY